MVFGHSGSVSEAGVVAVVALIGASHYESRVSTTFKLVGHFSES